MTRIVKNVTLLILVENAMKKKWWVLTGIRRNAQACE